MVLSILLLVLFQAYWLRKTYRDEFFSLRRELGLVLRETAVRRQFQQMATDSNWRMTGRVDSVRVENGKGITIIADSSSQIHATKLEVKIGVPLDSPTMRRSSRLFSFDSERRGDNYESLKELIVISPFFGDAKELQMLKDNYAKALSENDLKIAFTLSKLTRDQMLALTKGDTGRVNFSMRRGGPGNNMNVVEARFENPFWLLLPKMGWPLFFSFMMIGITIAAFLFLYRSLQTQHRLAALKNDFISNITHELKTPIATVGVAIEALRNFNAIKDPERTKEYLDISANELQRLGLLVDKVLRLSMFEEDKMELRKEAVDLKQVVSEVTQSMKLQLEKAGATVVLDAQDEKYTVEADRMHMLSVLYNLVDNAIKYSNENPVVKITLTNDHHLVKLSVADNGIGIPPEFRHKVFDKFFRVPHGNTHDIKGYGLGLSYVSEVVKKHGGTIEVETVSPAGSAFVITLPSAS
jgi:two-component system phosphate regulon sensor histidine kinase PhoR